jgi:hypothetical protein
VGRTAPGARAAAGQGAALLDALLRGPPPPRRGGKRGAFTRAQRVIFARARARGLLAARGPTAAVDATGLATHHVSAHYAYRYSPRYQTAYAQLHRGRRPKGRHRRPQHPKLTIAVHTASHLIAGALPTWGPAGDARTLPPVVAQAVGLLRLRTVVADAGFDGEPNHVVCREQLGIPQTVIRLNKRHGRRRPKTRYRRALRACFPWRVYHRRQHVECVFSRDKRRLGDALTARQRAHQDEEQILRVLTHNLMILLLRPPASFQRSR